MTAKQQPRPRLRPGSPRALSCLLLGAALQVVVGCRVTEGDIERWGTRAGGPSRLIAVLQHDKYSSRLRVDAAMTLITMKPRGGRAIGLQGDEETAGLLGGLAEVPAAERRAIVAGLVEPLERGMRLPLKDGADPTYPYKDAAFALLTQGDESSTGSELVTDVNAQKRLRHALVTWSQHDFARRLDNTSQLYSMEQLLEFLQDDALRGLTPLLQPDFSKLRELSKLVGELGAPGTQVDASKRLVKVARHIASPAWLDEKKPAVTAANQSAGRQISDKQLEKQLAVYQEEELLRVIGAMKHVGQTPIVSYLIDLAKDGQADEKWRRAALVSLEGNLQAQSREQAQGMLGLLADEDCPDVLRDLAARRIGEFSRELVATDLYRLFDADRWQVRSVAASVLLKMTPEAKLEEFMAQLGGVRRMAMSEVFTYGPLLKEVGGDESRGQVLALQYASASHPTPVRVSALGFFARFGSQEDIRLLSPYVADETRLPSCPSSAEEDPGCAWTCNVNEEGKLVVKELSTIGEFVDSCLIFAMKSRANGEPDGSNAPREKASDPEVPSKATAKTRPDGQPSRAGSATEEDPSSPKK